MPAGIGLGRHRRRNEPDQPYRSGVGATDWVKSEMHPEGEELVIAGYLPSSHRSKKADRGPL